MISFHQRDLGQKSYKYEIMLGTVKIKLILHVLIKANYYNLPLSKNGINKKLC